MKKRRIARRCRRGKPIRYVPAPDLQQCAVDICQHLFPYIPVERIQCFRSFGSVARGTIARCHGLAKIMQQTIKCSAYYAIEFIAERFDRLSEEEQLKTMIHELLHIPQNFGGGFKHHNLVTEREVNRLYQEYQAGRRGK